ncbi:MAG: hypothetical protein R3190_01130, partial [Thermoanaerobaculia bacterium]|nr:hypothetical protein [Thermoanaerobaculia bacterium]
MSVTHALSEAALPASQIESGAAESQRVASAFLDVLRRGDYPQLSALLAPDVWFRALLPGGLREEHDAEAVVAVFREWFEKHAEITLVHSQHYTVGTRELVSYRYRVRKESADTDLFVVEQTG